LAFPFFRIFARMNDFRNTIRAVAFDADDTLWDCQGYFDKVEEAYSEVLAPYADAATVSQALFRTECRNVPLTGYGSKAFALSLIENAVSVSNGQVKGEEIMRILELGYSLLRLPATPLPGVESTLKALHAQLATDGKAQAGREKRRYKLAVFTKGELLDQENKLHRSGLYDLFDVVAICSDKTRESFLRLCHELDVEPSGLCMVGNSLKSDIAPALAIGAKAIHIPFFTTWKHEEAEPIDDPRLRTISKFEDLLTLL